VVDVVSDTATVLDAVGVQRCLVIGWSGGGPHALACAARLGGATAVLSLAGFAPFDADGLDWFAGLPEDSVAEFSAAARSADELRPLISQWRDELTDVTAGDLAVGLQPVFADGELTAVTEEFLEDQVRWVSDGFRAGVEGCVDDELAFTRPWGFDLDEISVPTVIAHGTADLLVPPAHGRWLASAVPGAVTRYENGEGHFSLTLRPQDRLLDELITLANGGR
jgi:pimeloyl-ACP methyl ester carboxylesterase